MKKFQDLGRTLSKAEQKAIAGGSSAINAFLCVTQCRTGGPYGPLPCSPGCRCDTTGSPSGEIGTCKVVPPPEG